MASGLRTDVPFNWPVTVDLVLSAKFPHRADMELTYAICYNTANRSVAMRTLDFAHIVRIVAARRANTQKTLTFSWWRRGGNATLSCRRPSSRVLCTPARRRGDVRDAYRIRPGQGCRLTRIVTLSPRIGTAPLRRWPTRAAHSDVHITSTTARACNRSRPGCVPTRDYTGVVGK